MAKSQLVCTCYACTTNKQHCCCRGNDNCGQPLCPNRVIPTHKAVIALLAACAVTLTVVACVVRSAYNPPVESDMPLTHAAERELCNVVETPHGDEFDCGIVSTWQ